MKFTESEIVELKTSTSELKEAVISLGAMLNKHSKGTVYFGNNATVKEAVGKTVELKNNVGINYDSGLADITFSSGPVGSWIVTGWKEAQ